MTLDLTANSNPDRVLSFVADTAPDKRAKLIDELLAKPEWVDKWTMFYGDLFKNTTNKASTSLNRFAQGRNTFYQWIKQSLTVASRTTRWRPSCFRFRATAHTRMAPPIFFGGFPGDRRTHAGHHGSDDRRHV